MKNYKKLSVIGLAVLSLICSAFYFEKNLARQYLLLRTPLGSTVEEVQLYCKHAEINCTYVADVGYQNHDTDTGVGSKSVNAVLWERDYLVAKVDVSGFWGFDENGKLIDIWVRKDIDSL